MLFFFCKEDIFYFCIIQKLHQLFWKIFIPPSGKHTLFNDRKHMLHRFMTSKECQGTPLLTIVFRRYLERSSHQFKSSLRKNKKIQILLFHECPQFTRGKKIKNPHFSTHFLGRRPCKKQGLYKEKNQIHTVVKLLCNSSTRFYKKLI